MRIVSWLAGASWSLLAVCDLAGVAHAAPPTVVPSPGYDARLQEQRAAQRAASPADTMVVAPVVAERSRTHQRHKLKRRSD